MVITNVIYALNDPFKPSALFPIRGYPASHQGITIWPGYVAAESTCYHFIFLKRVD
jgi:hypothetical protein